MPSMRGNIPKFPLDAKIARAQGSAWLPGASPTRITLLALVSGLMVGCDGVLDPAGPVGSAERVILLDSVAIMLAMVLPTILCTLAFAWWYRATNRRAALLTSVGVLRPP